MSTYYFTKSGILKFYALDRDLRQSVPNYTGASYDEPSLSVVTSVALSESELTALGELITNYSDPAVFLELISTSTDATRSETTNSSTPSVVQSFIYSVTGADGNGVFNAIKSVIEYRTDDVSYWANFSGSLTATVSIKCYTRDYTFTTETLDITSVANSWKAMALDDPSGTVNKVDKVYKTCMLEGLRNFVANYDCIWVYVISVSNPNVYMTIHAKQMLYYNVM
jgi:hypothetical protein